MGIETETETVEGVPVPIPVQVPMETEQNDRLLKNHSLSSTQLFFDLKEGGIDLEPFSQPIRDKDISDEFEVVDLPAPFVTAAINESQKSFTENNASTFNTSNDARVDFFFHVMEKTTPELTISLLTKSWKVDALDTLKLIGSLRDIKDGKGIRQQYQHSLYWLYLHHPITLYNNLPQLLKLGYWKDALQMLMVVLFDGFVHPYFSFDDGNKKDPEVVGHSIGRKRTRRNSNKLNKQTDSEKRIYNAKIGAYYKIENYEKLGKKAMDALRFRYAREIFTNSTKYRIFHVRIAKIFAQQLSEDFALFQDVGAKNKNISLAAKWAPTLAGHFDRYTLISSTIATELAQLLKKEFLTKSIPTAVYLSRKFYNQEICVPLRAHLEIPEVRMSKNDWANVNYKRVPAKCMQKNKSKFIKHDNERLTAFLTKDGSKVAGASLKPIEIIRRAMAITDDTEEAEKLILEKQWTSLVDDIKKKGSLLAGAIAICDVSSSMHGDPMIGAIGLTLLTMEQTKSPWNEVCVTFNDTPTLYHLDTNFSLLEKVIALGAMPWGGSTNFQATLRLILDLGVKNNLSQDDMPKILFTFTDMQFNEAFNDGSHTNFEIAQKEFQEKGYTLPTMVFWNLRATARTSTPVQKDEHGVILLSGFSGQLLSFVMNQKELKNFTVLSFVMDLINTKKYETLKVYD